MLSDIEIAQAAKMQPITEIAANLGLQGCLLYTSPSPRDCS